MREGGTDVWTGFASFVLALLEIILWRVVLYVLCVGVVDGVWGVHGLTASLNSRRGGDYRWMGKHVDWEAASFLLLVRDTLV